MSSLLPGDIYCLCPPFCRHYHATAKKNSFDSTDRPYPRRGWRENQKEKSAHAAALNMHLLPAPDKAVSLWDGWREFNTIVIRFYTENGIFVRSPTHDEESASISLVENVGDLDTLRRIEASQVPLRVRRNVYRQMDTLKVCSRDALPSGHPEPIDLSVELVS
jgi:hypothetical protein